MPYNVASDLDLRSLQLIHLFEFKDCYGKILRCPNSG